MREATELRQQTVGYAPGSFGALKDRLESLATKAKSLGTDAFSVREAILGSFPEKGSPSAGVPKAVPNGHLDALDMLMSELSSGLDAIEESMSAISSKL